MKNIVNPNPQIYNQGGVPELTMADERRRIQAKWSLNGQDLPEEYGKGEDQGERYGQDVELSLIHI